MRSYFAAEAIAGTIAGAIMAMAMMVYMYLIGESVWTNPNLISAMWLGNQAANGSLSTATFVGFFIHEATSAVMGIIAVPFIKNLPIWRMLIVSIAYALASYPLVFAFVLTWANPIMVERSELIPMTVMHILFGLTMFIFYKILSPKE